ncbi:MAG: c-type cytochrome [Chitinophagaceae bacterium]|nr:c-type cytochrome [Chitinophagaceae bacterium]
MIAILSEVFSKPQKAGSQAVEYMYRENEEWRPPDTNSIPAGAEGDLIRYGRDLIAYTSKYLGPKGIVAHMSNGMNCQNCHIDAGTKPFGNSFAAVASTYPKFRERSGKVESIEFRVNECMERSMNGRRLENSSLEMKAMVEYLKWVGQGVPKRVKPKGAGTEELSFLPRAADPARGKKIYISKCQRCHGENGQGVLAADSISYTYPPLWGNNSYNVSAGMYRLSRLAGFIKSNMPFDSVKNGYKLSVEDTWDVAAYINSQPRPLKFFSYDWPNIATKPVDHPFGPYADSFSEEQHKYGPFDVIKKARERNKKGGTVATRKLN